MSTTTNGKGKSKHGPLSYGDVFKLMQHLKAYSEDSTRERFVTEAGLLRHMSQELGTSISLTTLRSAMKGLGLDRSALLLRRYKSDGGPINMSTLWRMYATIQEDVAQLKLQVEALQQSLQNQKAHLEFLGARVDSAVGIMPGCGGGIPDNPLIG